MPVKNIRLLGFASALLLSQHFLLAQDSKPILKVEGEISTPLNMSFDDFSTMPVSTVKAKDKDEKLHEFTGVALVEVLKRAGVTLGPQLRGANLAKYLVVRAADGYKVVYSLAEIDPEFTSDTVLIAFQVDGKPLAESDGPLRIVAPSDKKHARWVRQMTSIMVLISKN